MQTKIKNKMKTKKIISLITCTLIMSALMYICGNGMTFSQTKELDHIKNLLPETSEIKFYNGEIHIFTEDIQDI